VHATELTDEAQPMPMLVLVVVTTETVEVPQRGGTALLDGEVVVDLEVAADVAALDVALGAALLDRAACSGCKAESAPVAPRQSLR
jgi:hypothetical protein